MGADEAAGRPIPAGAGCLAPLVGGGRTPASTLTCTDAVEHIMTRPAEPQPPKYCSIATYLGWSTIRTGGRTGSTPKPMSRAPGSGGAGPEDGEIVPHDVDGLRDGWPWAGAELDLPTGLDGQLPIEAATRREIEQQLRMAMTRVVRRQPVRVPGINDQQLEFDADLRRWSVLETGPRDPGLRGRLGERRLDRRRHRVDRRAVRGAHRGLQGRECVTNLVQCVSQHRQS